LSRRTARVIDCTPAEARGRRDQARAYLDVADTVLVESASRYEAQVAAALAVLAAIAAADAICGLKLHQYSRGQDHAQAVKLLEAVDLEDTSLPGKLCRILASKDSVHYSPHLVSATEATSLRPLPERVQRPRWGVPEPRLPVPRCRQVGVRR
jgi:hypothetical protein